MVRIGHRYDKVPVAHDAAHVLRRAGALALDAPGVSSLVLGPQHTLKEDLVLPGIARVVLVPEADRPLAPREDLAQLRTVRVPVIELLKVLLHQHRVAVELVTD